MPSFQHLPAPLRSPARRLILYDPLLPAPELLNGLAKAWFLNKIGTQSYLLERTKTGGWWYFFLLAIGVKTPLPLLILFGIGLAALVARQHWIPAMPLASLLGILLITMRVSYQVGTRHVLVVLPLAALVAGIGTAVLFEHLDGTWESAGPQSTRNWRFAFSVSVVLLLLCVASFRKPLSLSLTSSPISINWRARIPAPCWSWGVISIAVRISTVCPPNFIVCASITSRWPSGAAPTSAAMASRIMKLLMTPSRCKAGLP